MTPVTVELPYKPFPKQAAFHASSAPYRLFGGAAGPGKSEAIMWEGVIKCILKPKIAGVLFRKTFPELEMSLIRRFLEKVPSILYKYDSGKHIARFYNGSILQFAYADNDNDVYRYQSAEFDFIGVDELTHFTEYFFTYMLSRLRTTKVGVRPSFFAATNPGNIGHGWVRSRWVTKSSQANGYTSAEYDFIPARVYDNPVLLNVDPEYLKRLQQLPEAQRKALLDGSFDVFEGQFFEEWNTDKHVIRKLPVPLAYCRKVIGFDWGYNAPGCAVWLAIAPENSKGVSHIYVYREMYQTRKNPQEWGEAIAAMLKLEPVDYMVLPHDCFAQEKGHDSIAKTFQDVGVRPIRRGRTLQRGARNNRAALTHKYLAESPDGTPYMQFLPTCPNTIRTLPELVYDKTNPEDVDTRGEDHAFDGLSLGLMSWFGDAKESGSLRLQYEDHNPKPWTAGEQGQIQPGDFWQGFKDGLDKPKRGWEYGA